MSFLPVLNNSLPFDSAQGALMPWLRVVMTARSRSLKFFSEFILGFGWILALGLVLVDGQALVARPNPSEQAEW